MAKRTATKRKSAGIADVGGSRAKGDLARAPAGDPLLREIRALIEESRQQVARTVNAALVWLYWNVGKRIRQDVLQNQRAGYGEEIVSTLSAQLTAEYGRGFDRRNLFHMIRFTEVFPDEQIVNALRSQLSWTHFRELLSVDDPLKREFYAEMCRIERWSTRTLRTKIDRMLFERTAVAKKPEQLIEQDLTALRDEDQLTPDLVFRDPYFLDFLGLAGPPYASNSVSTLPLTSVRRMSRLMWWNVSFLWSSPSKCRQVACRSGSETGFSTAA